MLKFKELLFCILSRFVLLLFLNVLVSGPAPWGGIPGPCSPKRKLCPPKRVLCPEETNRLRATGVQIEAEIGVCHGYFCSLTLDFLGWRPCSFSFLRDYMFSAGKTFSISDFGWKIPLNFSEYLFFDLHLVRLIQTGINFSCPRAPLEFTEINFSCPPKIYFCLPSHSILAPGLPGLIYVRNRVLY